MRKGRFYSLAVFMIAFLMQSCVIFGVEAIESAWQINNNSSHEVIACTVSVKNNEIIASDYVDPVVMIPRNYHYKAGIMYSDELPTEKLAQGEIRIYFVEVNDDTSQRMDLRNVASVVANADAYIILMPEWMKMHGYNINYPEDCTIIQEEELNP